VLPEISHSGVLVRFRLACLWRQLSLDAGSNAARSSSASSGVSRQDQGHYIVFHDPPRLARDATTADEALQHSRRVRGEIRALVETLPEALDSQAGIPA
jgi:hypothetical protein